MSKYELICKNCNQVNYTFEVNCSKCNSILRNKVVNIDFWNIITRLIEKPFDAFLYIIQSENKNYIFIISLMASIKMIILNYFISNYFFETTRLTFTDFTISFIIFLVICFLHASIIKFILKQRKIKSRIKDTFTNAIYAFIPMMFTLIIIFPLEAAIFGEYLFSKNPSPFTINKTFAYLFSILEISSVLWVFILFIVSNYIYSSKKLFSLIYSLIIFGCFLLYNFIYILYLKT